jgi:hypothetical protein
MPQAILSTLEYDPLVPITIELLPSSEPGDVSRRVNRIATLDGGAVFNDFGFTEADRTITLRWRPVSAAHEAGITRLVKLYPKLTCAIADGLFLAAPQTYTPGENNSLLILLVERRLDA